MHKIVVTRPLVGRWREILEEHGEVVLAGGPEGPERGLLESHLADADALVTLLTDRVDGPLIQVARQLKVIGNYAVGVDNIDVESAARKGITVCHTPNVLTDATADLAVALMLAACRRIVEADGFVRRREWSGWRPDLFLGMGLRGKRLGILGFGRIGQAVAQRAAAFGLEIAYHARSRKAIAGLSATYCALDELIESSDILTIHVPLTSDTKRLIDEVRIQSMKSGAVLINTARGQIVDEAALANALKTGHLFAAGLDVFECEPQVHEDLLRLDNVVMAPHIGSATAGVRTKMAESLCDDVGRVLNGETPNTQFPSVD